MPSSATPHGTFDAIAVSTTVGHELTSAYMFLLDHIVLLVWSLIVISGLILNLRIHKARHPHDPLMEPYRQNEPHHTAYSN
jgi:hypothetical protein